ncbi:hypothetical protein N8198_01865 [Gammaproteobacteria bacterium]|nr:hypothetical protein [Gammaproteobacteria bacterium]
MPGVYLGGSSTDQRREERRWLAFELLRTPKIEFDYMVMPISLQTSCPLKIGSVTVWRLIQEQVGRNPRLRHNCLV